MDLLAVLVVFLPLAGSVLAGIVGLKREDYFAQGITTGFLLLSALFATILFTRVGLDGESFMVPLMTWMDIEFLRVDWGLQVDSLSVVMMIVVTYVSSMVHMYSIGYMKGDPGVPRFMSYLSLFTFAMLMLVTAPNLVQMFFGWEGVGVCSYLLIGFWYEKDSANAASIKAFLVNRVGDIGFALGIFTIFAIFGTVDFNGFLPSVAEHGSETFKFLGYEGHALTIASILLFIGAMGKSAQIGLHVWLPDAMEGPTPVSALIHAATMVTAGVFMVVRLSPLMEYAPLTRDIIVVVGGLTALFAATVACTQNDIKRIIAYSTCSQLGYMFMAAGVSAYGASMFHLVTHAFFKALLFLGAGAVIHAMSDEQDIRKMGGIWKLIPTTYVLMWVGSLALAGIPFFAGYFSKDIILESIWAQGGALGQVFYMTGIFVALLTAFYSWRLIIMVFHGVPRADERVMSHVHESPLVMLIPLAFLAVGAVFSGYMLNHLFVGEGTRFWQSAIEVLDLNNTIERAHHGAPWVGILPTGVALVGIALAYGLYTIFRSVPDVLSRAFSPLYKFLLNKWYVDEVSEAIFILPSMALGRILWMRGDGMMIDGLGPNGIAAVSWQSGGVLCRLQTGYLYHYAFAMVVGMAAMMLWSMHYFG